MSAPLSFPWMLYRAIRTPTGQNVCVHPDFLHQTTRVVKSAGEYDSARDEGWFDKAEDAMAALEDSQAAGFEGEARRNKDDERMSDKAKAEADEVSRRAGFTPTPEIPEAPKKGRYKKDD